MMPLAKAWTRWHRRSRSPERTILLRTSVTPSSEMPAKSECNDAVAEGPGKSHHDSVSCGFADFGNTRVLTSSYYLVTPRVSSSIRRGLLRDFTSTHSYLSLERRASRIPLHGFLYSPRDFPSHTDFEAFRIVWEEVPTAPCRRTPMYQG